MNKAGLPPIAIIADAHVHDINSDYDFPGISVGGKPLTIRSWADTRRSSRVFNESKAALSCALHDIDKRGIKHVVLLGDYTDDGQIESTTRLVHTLRQHRDQYGTQFYAITGNHDAYGPSGKHQSTRFAIDTHETVLVTSDPAVAASELETAVLTSKMYCEGVADGISRMSEFGLFKQPEYVHWETPFGLNAALEHRHYSAMSKDGRQSHQLIDASYLVEPVKGLWLLMIDANVFEPRNGHWTKGQKKAFIDSSDAGWNSVLRNRRHIINWITDVCTRADQNNKHVIAFSHYPIIDPFQDANNRAFTLFGSHEMLRRKPEPNVSIELLKAGLRLHFSGHLHVSALSRQTAGTHAIDDCAVPSLVAFPACYNVVQPDPDNTRIHSVSLSSMSLNSKLMTHYRKEDAAGEEADHAALSAITYGDFLYRRMHCRVIHHFLNKEWPTDIASSIRVTNTFDLAVLMMSDTSAANANALAPQALTCAPDQLKSAIKQYGLSYDDLITCRMTQLLSDWYCFRHAGAQARAFMEPTNLKIYRYLAENFGDQLPYENNTHKAYFAVFLALLNASIRHSEQAVTQQLVTQTSGEYSDY